MKQSEREVTAEECKTGIHVKGHKRSQKFYTEKSQKRSRKQITAEEEVHFRSRKVKNKKN